MVKLEQQSARPSMQLYQLSSCKAQVPEHMEAAPTSFRSLPKYWWSSGLSSGRPSISWGTSNFCPRSSSGIWYRGVAP